jgi:hypothetical protein
MGIYIGRYLVMPPFLVLSLPRSRSTWLSRFLTYRQWFCGHEQALHFREIADARSWLAQPFTGSAETGVARWWPILKREFPDTRIAIVRRPVDEVVESLMTLGPKIGVTYNREPLLVEMHRQNRALDQIAKRFPAVSVNYDELATETGCKTIFEHCLGMEWDQKWWKAWNPIKIECDMRQTMRYVTTHQPQLKTANQHFLSLVRPRRSWELRSLDSGVVMQVEPFNQFWHDAGDLFREHCETVGETEEAEFNIPLMRKLDDAGCGHIVTARLNGRMMGYLCSVISPSLKHGNLTALQTAFFVTKDAAGLKL